MSTRKTAELRTKEIRLAILRIERGRAHSGEKKLSISSVAREVGVTPALIHNAYPELAEEIRTKQGASSRNARDAKHIELRNERKRSKELRQEIDVLRDRIARLASINESLLMQIDSLNLQQHSANVLPLARTLRP